MRIKKLEIVGFKSFCDRTILHFNEPITGVVGPNGCGKSNVVDAIRWCMGEQSAKHLRGKAMEDVIFSGSDRRGPLGYCEVALTFENDGRVPIEYLPYSEITVGRRLFRDGTSEYYLNKTPCRLRDISEFFMGTGIGTRAYSIIEQGRVGMIVTSKPEERRFLIEEAAGITKYKAKRKAAEKKIELTQQNLLRVTDVITEQEKQLASLKRQAEKAERYKHYRTELRDIELWGFTQRWLTFGAEAERVANELTRVNEERERTQAELAAIEGRLAASRLTLADEERQLQEVQEELYALNNRVKLGEAENEHDRKEEERLLSQAQRLREELNRLEQRSLQSAVEQAEKQAELEQLDVGGGNHGEQVTEHEGKLKGHKDELTRVQRQTDSAKAEISKQTAEIARAEADERSLVRQRDEVALRLQRAQEESQRLGGRREELGQLCEDQESRLTGLQHDKVSLVKSRSDTDGRVKELKMQVSRLEKEVDQLRGELHKRRGRLHSLSEIAARYEGFATGTRAILQRARQQAPAPSEAPAPPETKDRRGKDSKKRPPEEPPAPPPSGDEPLGGGIRGVVADIIIAPAELEVAIDAALGERLGALVVDDHAVGVEAIRFLRERGEGRASFVPLETRPTRPSDRPPRPDDEAKSLGVRGRLLDLCQARPGYEAVLDALLGNVLIIDSVDSALAYYSTASDDNSLSPAGLLVTLDGVLIDGHGVISGGAQRGQGASVLAQKRELRELTAQVADLDAGHREKDELLAVSKAEMAHLSKQLEDLQRAGHAGEMQILSLDKDLTRTREELHRLTHRGEVLGGEIEEMSTRQEDLAREAEETRLEIRAARDLLSEFEGRRDLHSREQLRLFADVEAASAEITKLKVAAAAYREKQTSLRHTLERLEREGAERRGAQERLQEEVRGCYQRSAQIKTQVANRAQELLALAEQSQRMSEELQVQRNDYETRRGSLSSGEGQVRERRGRENALLKESTKLEVKLNEQRSAAEHVEEAAMERHRVVIAEIVPDYAGRPPISENDERRLRELRDLIDKMGEINLMAIEEYQQLSERHQFLLMQRADLETALAQLNQAITLINRTCKRRFREVFDLVNAKFQEIFPRCFVGGQARLILTKEDDLLESGIEIFAQPPGKKNQTVELLSGGEKAMTAVALIFAIFLIKPSPFCLLDEVDAPLDEANVGRFNDLIREMTDRSQFIVITHNKRTMQIVDTIYGVTMEEPGVSKLVSVNLGELSKLEKKAGKARAA